MSSDLPDFTIDELEHLESLDFDTFTNDDAVTLGLLAVDVIRERDLNMAVDIVVGDDLVFRAKLKDTGPQNDEWLAGKAAVARQFGEPSLLVKQRHLAAGTPFAERDDIDHSSMRAHGGSIPIRVRGAIVGTITASGEPDVVDHAVAAEALRRFIDL